MADVIKHNLTQVVSKLCQENQNGTICGQAVTSQGLGMPRSLMISIILMVCALGIPSNITIILIYAKLKFTNTMFISYTALAVSDLGVVFSMIAVALIKLRQISDLIINTAGADGHLLCSLVVGRFVVAFTRCTGFITAWISLERCLCVACPLKVKAMITRRLTCAVMVVLFFVSLMPAAILYIIYWFQWKDNDESNFSALLDATSDARIVVNLVYIAIYPAVYYTTTATCTAILVLKLRRNSQWRLQNASTTVNNQGKANDGINERESRTIQTVTVLALTLIIFSLPYSINTIVAEFVEDYSPKGSLKWLFWLVSGVSFTLNAINSVINVFVYAYMGSNFRTALRETMCRVFCK